MKILALVLLATRALSLRPPWQEYNQSLASQATRPPTGTDGQPTGQSRIPKIVWYTHKSKEHLRAGFESELQELNPLFSLRFVDDAAAIHFINKTVPQYLHIYNQIRDPAHRADMWRYLALYVHGGYYVDTDDEPLVSFEKISGSNDFVSVVAATSPKGVHIHNGFMATVPGNPFVKKLLSHFLHHPKPEMSYSLCPYHYYVRYFYELVNASLSSAGGLTPLTMYTFRGMHMTFLYHEYPWRYVIDSDGKLVYSMGTNKKQWRTGNPGELYRLEPGFPFELDLSSKKWHPVLNDIHAHVVTPLANYSGPGPLSQTTSTRALSLVRLLRENPRVISLWRLPDSSSEG